MAGGHGPRPAAVVPRPPHQGRQRPARHHPRAAARRHPRRRLRRADRRRPRGRHEPGGSSTPSSAGQSAPVRRRRRRGRQHRRSGQRPTRSPTRAAARHDLADVAWAAQRYATLQAVDEAVRARRVADAWCAAFLTPKTDGAEPITTRTLLDQLRRRHRRRERRSTRSTRSPPGTGSSTGIWSSPRSSRVPDDGPANTDDRLDRRLLRRCWATPRGSGSSCRSRSSSPPATPRSPTPPNAAARKKAIAALATRDPALARRVRRRQAAVRGREPVPAHQRPVPALRRRRRQHLQRLRRALPHEPRPSMADRGHHPDRAGHRRHDCRVLRRHASEPSGWPPSTTSRTRPRSSPTCTTRSGSRCRP